MFLHNIKE